MLPHGIGVRCRSWCCRAAEHHEEAAQDQSHCVSPCDHAIAFTSDQPTSLLTACQSDGSADRSMLTLTEARKRGIARSACDVMIIRLIGQGKRLHTSHPMMDEGDVMWSWRTAVVTDCSRCRCAVVWTAIRRTCNNSSLLYGLMSHAKAPRGIPSREGAA